MYTGIRRFKRSVSVWPGYVDALSALLMVVIFVVLIFIVVHFMLSQIVSGQEQQLAVLHRQLSELTEKLGLQTARAAALTDRVAQLSGLIGALTADKSALTRRVGELSEISRRDRAAIEQKLLVIARLQEDIAALRQVRIELEARVGQLAAAIEDKALQIGRLRNRAMALAQRLATEQERTLLSQKTIDKKEIRIEALGAVIVEQKEALDQQRQLSASARAEVALLTRRIAAMSAQLEEINRALTVTETIKQEQAAQIEDLGRRLNIALARRVNQLESYRSEFFGRVRRILGDHSAVRIEGDRFVFQAELLFDSGSAQLGQEGRHHLAALAGTLRDLSRQIPEDINWILRIDGHTDRVPIHNAQFASNWELSTARAVSVVRFLASLQIPEKRMAAAGFGQFHPLDRSDNADAYRRNRRIEIKLTAK